jgi:hypothetical protein
VCSSSGWVAVGACTLTYGDGVLFGKFFCAKMHGADVFPASAFITCTLGCKFVPKELSGMKSPRFGYPIIV